MEYDKKVMNEQADSLEKYLEVVRDFVIIEGLSEEEYNDSMKTVKKLIKKLRKGEGDEVYNKERYYAIAHNEEIED